MSAQNRLWKIVAALIAVAAAFTVTFVWPRRNGLDIDIDGSPRAKAARNLEPYDLTQLQVLNRAILEVKDHYVDPSRVKPQRMFLGGLNAIQRAVAPVLVHYEEGKPEVTVQVDTMRRNFRIDDIQSPWALANRFRNVFAFVQANLKESEVDLRDIEYAAVNGMLRTLDPHSVLLTPDIFEEMQMSTRGKFGGLGIVISIRDGHLTIMRPMPNTPAARAELKPKDRIVKINDESTLNMPLSEAVDRLRGAPGSAVAVWISRKNGETWSDATRHDLVRAVINIDSVESRMLADRIGYLKIRSFQGNTYKEMRQALASLRERNMRGLVLDMRDDPGGLLDQAVRIADAFLSSGAIVTTSSNDPSQRDEKFARKEGTEPDYPIVVLVNGGSASASEIVAGALKNHDRALIVGQRTFGKGSVQVLYNFRDGSALKLTIAQYLTPGDVSIQGVGIVPDIGIEPMTVDRDEMDLATDRDYLRESDLRSHLTHARARESEQPANLLRYYLPQETRMRLRQATPEEQEENEKEAEFLTRFSQKLLASAKGPSRLTMLRDAKPVIAQIRQEEMARAIAELKRLGVDWNSGPDRGATDLKVEVTTGSADNTVMAGDSFELRVKVTNRGANPVQQLRAITKSDFRLFDGRELVFGKIAPGESRSWSTTLGICNIDPAASDGSAAVAAQKEAHKCVVPRDVPDRADGIRVEFSEEHDHAPPAAEIRTVVRALPRPQFAYALQIADNLRGNGDGRIQRGERGAMYLLVRNIGRGKTYDAQANLRNLSGQGILLQDGRFQLRELGPGQEQSIRFSFEVLPEFDRKTAKFEVSIGDMELREVTVEKVEIPVTDDGPAPAAKLGWVQLKSGTSLIAAPDEDADKVATVDGGARLRSEAVLGSFVRVGLGDGRTAWARTTDIQSKRGGKPGKLNFYVNHTPPLLDVDYGKALVTREPFLSIKGKASDDHKIRDLYVFVGGRKVFYQSNRNASNPYVETFNAKLRLKGGTNYISVFVRENDDVLSRQTFVVRRDASNGALIETPRHDSELYGEDEEYDEF